MVVSVNAAGFGLSVVLRLVDDRIKTFISGALKVILYTVLYLIIGLLCLNIVINIHLICSGLDPLILKLIASIGGGLSWVAVVVQIGIILGLIRRIKVKKP